ncbi:hypothetical protein VPHD181_0320 [Vibrio phage D181]
MFDNFVKMQEQVKEYLEVHAPGAYIEHIRVYPDFHNVKVLTLQGSSGSEACPYENSSDSYECTSTTVPRDFFENYDKHLEELKAKRKAESDARKAIQEKNREEYERGEYERLKAKFSQ